jgi:prolyl-tRNA synthetase
MRASQFFISTLKDAPADADITSQKLMLRAGMIRKLASGIYNYMPMGLRVIRKVENIIREEMNAAGAVELLMPVVQPAELWMETGRWQKYGPELMRIKDRNERDFIVQPTSEEAITDIARNEIKSYRQLPVNFYHIQTKFRDERRPRFGVMRGREFTMKDAYSFDKDEAGAAKSYDNMFAAYVKIFTRLGLTFRPVRADTGTIGGSRSHEFQVIADTGEDAIAYCPTSDYAANIELAEALPLIASRAAPTQAMAKTPTPGKSKCEDVAELLKLPLQQTVKSIVLAVEKTDNDGHPAAAEIWLLLLRGDHDLNEIKANKVPGLNKGFRFATEEEILATFSCRPGYIGPLGMEIHNVYGDSIPAASIAQDVASGKVRREVSPGRWSTNKFRINVVVDRTVANMSDFVTGANDPGFHYTGVNWGRDLPEPEMVADIRNVVIGDPSPDGKGILAIQRGIEVGHVFFLGTVYSEPMKATFLAEDGKPQPMQMGCYGIGVTRLLGAAIEQNHDERGIIWPDAMAPFTVAIAPMGYERSAMVKEAADKLHAELSAAGIDVLLDDRGERPGVMLAELELIGIPHRIVVGERGLKEGKVEYQQRRDVAATPVALADIAAHLKGKL